MKSYRLLWNDDGGRLRDYHPPVPPERFLRDQFACMEGTGVDAFFCALGCCTGYATAYPTQVPGAEYLLDRYQAGAKLGNLGFWRMAENLKHLADLGLDYIGLQQAEARRLGLDFWLHLRMNDWHHAANCAGKDLNLLAGRFYTDHPEYLIGPAGFEAVPALAWCVPWFQDFQHEAVRRLRLDILEEACARYAPDGFQYDFMRCPGYFKPGGEAAGTAVMTDFIRQSRAAVNRIGAGKGRRIGFSVRVPNTIEGSEKLGLDVRRWMREGLVDLVVPSTFFHADQDEDMAPWVEEGRRTGVGIYPAIEEHYSAHHTGGLVRLFYNPPVLLSLTPEMACAIAARHYQSGVNGLYLFNWRAADFGATLDKRPLLSALGDPRKLAGCNKTYILSRRDGLFPNCLPLRQIPVTISGQPARVSMRVADDLEQGRARLKTVELRVHYLNLTVRDRIEVRVNGTPVSCRAPLESGTPALPEGEGLPAAAWLAYDLRGALPVCGRNTIEFQADAREACAAREFPIEVVDLELDVAYAYAGDLGDKACSKSDSRIGCAAERTSRETPLKGP